jgi:predicted methyltransferase
LLEAEGIRLKKEQEKAELEAEGIRLKKEQEKAELAEGTRLKKEQEKAELEAEGTIYFFLFCRIPCISFFHHSSIFRHFITFH